MHNIPGPWKGRAGQRMEKSGRKLLSSYMLRTKLIVNNNLAYSQRKSMRSNGKEGRKSQRWVEHTNDGSRNISVQLIKWALRWWQGQRGTGCAEASLPQREWEQPGQGGSGRFQSCFEEGRTHGSWRTLRFQSGLWAEYQTENFTWKKISTSNDFCI